MHPDRQLDTVRGVGKILRSERGDRKGSGGGGGGGSEPGEGKCHEDSGNRRGNGVEEAVAEKREIKSRQMVPPSIRNKRHSS